MRNIIKIKDRNIIVESSELSPFEITDIEAKIEQDFRRLEEKNIINHITQLYTLVAKYAVESYINSKKNKIDEQKINARLDELIEKTRNISGDLLF